MMTEVDLGNGYTNRAFEIQELPKNGHSANGVHEVPKVQIDHEDEGGECGWRLWRPKILQKFKNAKYALLFMCWAATVQGMVVNGFVNVSISTIEKRYHLKSANTGLIAGFYDIASVLCSIPVSYLGSRPGASKPRWLGWGLLIMGMGSFVFTIPHFAAPYYNPVSSNSGNESSYFCGSHSQLEEEEEDCFSRDKWLSSFKYVFILGSFLHGVGACPLYTLGVAYLDESVPLKMSSLYVGIFETMAVIGPAIGYLLGGQLLNIFIDTSVDPSTIGISYGSNLWLGAWWVGFLISGSLAIFVSWIILAFPAELPGAKSRAVARLQASSYHVTHNFGKLSELPNASKVLLKNLPYVTLTLAETSEGFMMSGFATFMPKIIESQFSLSSATAAMLVGAVMVPAGGGGTFLGGWFIKKFSLNCLGIIKMALTFSFISCIFCFFFFFSCPNINFSGVTIPYSNSAPEYLSLNSSCNSNCLCNPMEFDPVCGSDNTLYFSPCYAGCSRSSDVNNNLVFSSCECITNNVNTSFVSNFLNSKAISLAIRQPCPSQCILLPMYLGLIFIVITFIFLVTIPSVTATLRFVPDTHRSLALGLQWIAIRVCGTIPGPIIFGIIVDKTCNLWQKTCDGSGACRNYDNNIMGRAVVGLGLGLRIISTLFYFLTYFLYKRRHKSEIQSVEVQEE